MGCDYYLCHFFTIVYTTPSENTKTITVQRHRDCMYFPDVPDIDLLNEDGSYKTAQERLDEIEKYKECKQLIFTNGGWANKRFETMYSNSVRDHIKMNELGVDSVVGVLPTIELGSIEDIGCTLVDVYVSTEAYLRH